jgi:3-hydroxyacyl-CoA dehydrogenase/enoyl-CoA hydratase/3-hydroxybutyryl-CoA epimerase
MLSEELLGRKTGAGFYKYEGKQQTPNESIAQWRQASGDAGKANNDLANRLLFLMINEAARCLEEKVVVSPDDADYGMVLGTGFPAFRGGPLRFADHFGAKRIVDEMNKLAQSEAKFAPCALLQEHGQAGTGFYEKG